MGLVEALITQVTGIHEVLEFIRRTGTILLVNVHKND